MASVTSVSGKLSHTNTPHQAKVQGHWPPQSFQTLSPWLPTSTSSHILLLLSTDTHAPQSSDCLLLKSSWSTHSSFHSGNPTFTSPCHVCDHFFHTLGNLILPNHQCCFFLDQVQPWSNQRSLWGSVLWQACIPGSTFLKGTVSCAYSHTLTLCAHQPQSLFLPAS